VDSPDGPETDAKSKPPADATDAKDRAPARSTDTEPSPSAKSSSDGDSPKPAAKTARAPKRAAATERRTASSRRPSMSKVKGGADAIRNRVAALVWLIAVLAAAILAVGALLVALDANPENDVVDFFRTLARDIDGPFSDVFTFDGDNAQTKERLVNWGLAAIAYLVVGKILDRIIRP